MYENEILTALLGTVVWIFIGLYDQNLKQLPAVRWLYASYAAVWCAWVATNLEHLGFAQFFNLLEHVGYALNGVLLFVWCWLGMKNGKAVRHG